MPWDELHGIRIFMRREGGQKRVSVGDAVVGQFAVIGKRAPVVVQGGLNLGIFESDDRKDRNAVLGQRGGLGQCTEGGHPQGRKVFGTHHAATSLFWIGNWFCGLPMSRKIAWKAKN